MNKFWLYEYIDPRTMRPFYVGKAGRKRRWNEGKSINSIAEHFPVTPANINAIVKGYSWKHIPRL